MKLKPNEAFLVSSYSNILYFTQLPLFSKDEREAYLLITKKDKFIITDKRYSEEVSSKLPDLKLIDIGALRFLKEELEDFCKEQKIKTLLFEEENLSFLEYKMIKKVNPKPFKNSDLRLIKEGFEIENMKKACKLTDECFSHIQKKIEKGISEKEIALEIEYFMKQMRHDISFNPIVAFGKNSSVPHHLSDDTKLKENQVVLLDFGAKVNNYCSDMTRTIFFGKADPALLKIYGVVSRAQNLVLDYLRTNKKIIAKNVDKVARDFIIDMGYNSFTHSLGHGIGIEVHEKPYISPRSNEALEANMVFSIEPGIYIEGLGGVRIEDLVVMTKNGPQLISKSNRGIIELSNV